MVSAIAAGNSPQKSQGHFAISARLPVANLDPVESAIRQEIERLQNEPISAQELNRIQTQVANGFIFANEKPSDRANCYGYFFSQLQDLNPAIHYPAKILVN